MYNNVVIWFKRDHFILVDKIYLYSAEIPSPFFFNPINPINLIKNNTDKYI